MTTNPRQNQSLSGINFIVEIGKNTNIPWTRASFVIILIGCATARIAAANEYTDRLLSILISAKTARKQQAVATKDWA